MVNYNYGHYTHTAVLLLLPITQGRKELKELYLVVVIRYIILVRLKFTLTMELIVGVFLQVQPKLTLSCGGHREF